MLGETASLNRPSYRGTLSPHDFQLSKVVPLSPPGLLSDPGPTKHRPLHAKPQQNCQEGADCSGIWRLLWACSGFKDLGSELGSVLTLAAVSLVTHQATGLLSANLVTQGWEQKLPGEPRIGVGEKKSPRRAPWFVRGGFLSWGSLMTQQLLHKEGPLTPVIPHLSARTKFTSKRIDLSGPQKESIVCRAIERRTKIRRDASSGSLQETLSFLLSSLRMGG